MVSFLIGKTRTDGDRSDFCFRRFFCVAEPKRLLQLSNISRFECQKESFGMDEFIFIYDLLSIGGLGKSKTKWAESPMTSIGGCVKTP